MLAIVLRKEASLKGLLFYFTGKPCKFGHSSQRKVQNGECCECRDTRFNTAVYRGIHKEAQANAAKAWAQRPEIKQVRAEQKRLRYWANYEKHRASDNKYHNLPHVKEWMKAYKAIPKNKDRMNALSRRRLALNPEIGRWKHARRTLAMVTATPFWSEKEEIANFYMNRPDGYQVDHIIPLQSEFVCGLHVIANLQYLTPAENQSKRNKFNPDEHEVIYVVIA